MDSLFVLGSNGSGQLGVGHTEDVSKPTAVTGLPNVDMMADMVAGGNHSIVLLSNQSIAATGENEDGRCFTNGKSNTHKFEILRHAPDSGKCALECLHIAATWSATFGIDKNGKVLAAGSGNAGELGLGQHLVRSESPTPIEDFPPSGTRIVKIKACLAHVVALLSNGEVWGWGQGRKGQLGTPLGIVWKPRRLSGIDFFAFDVACGKDFTCIVGDPVEGALTILGLQGRDRFGVKTAAPHVVRGWKQVAASWGSIFVLYQSGQLVGWGRDDHGQLPPSGLPPLASIAAGSEHCLGLTETGTVLAWGWGEHGNCGDAIDPNGDVRDRWNQLQIPHAASAIFAGCATSFIATLPRNR